jgi:tetratricopeptide (TPR) repeat protein
MFFVPNLLANSFLDYVQKHPIKPKINIYQGTIDKLLERLKKEPENLELYMKLSDLYYDVALYSESIDILKQVPKTAQLNNNQMVNLYIKLVEQSIKTNRYKEAECYLTDGLKYNLHTQFFYEKLVLCNIHLKKYKHAAAYMKKAAIYAYDPSIFYEHIENENINDIYQLFFLGSYYLEQKEYKKAQKYLSQAFEKNKIEKNVYLFEFIYEDLLDLYDATENYDEMIRFLKYAVRDTRHVKEYYAALGLSYIRKEKYKEALNCIENSLKLDPLNERLILAVLEIQLYLHNEFLPQDEKKFLELQKPQEITLLEYKILKYIESVLKQQQRDSLDHLFKAYEGIEPNENFIYRIKLWVEHYKGNEKNKLLDVVRKLESYTKNS